MIMEKGMSSVEVLPSKSSQVTAVKVIVKEHETKSIQKGKRVGFVLVHAGAGYHSESKAKEYKHVCKRACQKAIEKLQAGALATDAVTAALIELEDSPFTNAGMGSNLNLLGEIECDASIMDGKSLNFGAVGALSGIKNPVSVANRLLCEGQKGKLSAGRIPPCFLVGEGAYRWAVDHGIPACSPGIMTTSSPFLANEDGVLGGVIVLRSCRCSAEPDSLQEKQTLLVEFLWSHTTESMCVGYMSAQDGKAKDLPKERLTPENPSDRFQPRALKEVSVICHAGETVAASHTKPCGGSFKSWPAQHCSAVCLELVTKPPQSPPQADSEVSGATPQARCRLT
ncbi:threonine aspartase 1 isoform X14 [Chelonia mydas]|uniref:threonine aspartase 1 isoform X14 n=1 Tax=Chelonia mydas TaxID=8469 RepID=UPI001CA84A26|nr:threonine aspartase 1 isoform X14 [Chelonia mydas]